MSASPTILVIARSWVVLSTDRGKIAMVTLTVGTKTIFRIFWPKGSEVRT